GQVATGPRMLAEQPRAALLTLRVGRYARRVEHGRRCDSRALQVLGDLLVGLPASPAGDRLVERVLIGESVFQSGEARIFAPLGSRGDGAERMPLVVAEDRDRHPTLVPSARVDAVRSRVARTVSIAPRR